eukprot:382348-Prorocentrum_minimum.AAC.2
MQPLVGLSTTGEFNSPPKFSLDVVADLYENCQLPVLSTALIVALALFDGAKLTRSTSYTRYLLGFSSGVAQ